LKKEKNSMGRFEEVEFVVNLELKGQGKNSRAEWEICGKD
jgi:hypothetical protein